MFDRFWAPGANLGAVGAAGPKRVRQSSQHGIKIEAPRLPWVHLGPKVVPKGGQDIQKQSRTEPPEGSGRSFCGLFGDCIAKLAIS